MFSAQASAFVLSAVLSAGLSTSAPAAPASDPALELEQGDVICVLGGALAERMQHHGWLETRLQRRFPRHELTVRNLGFSADELTVHQRTMNFGKFTADGMDMTLENERFVPWDRYLDHCDADVVLAFFGYNESFAGLEGLAAFRADLASFIDHVTAQRYGDSAPRLVLFGSIPHEDAGGRGLPDGRVHNQRILAYNAAMREVAEERGVLHVDLYTPMVRAYAESDEPLTINGIHLTSAGNERLAQAIDAALFGATPPGPGADGDLARLREAILEKNELWFNRYRATDGYNVYGGRSRKVYAADGGGGAFANFDVLQREMDHIDVLCANRDRRIWRLAQGEDGAVDDSNAPPLLPVLTNAPGDGPEGAYAFLTGVESPTRMTAAPGMRVELFADELQFPELVNPVQMAWDTRGRLWVAVWPTYPHWTPGQPMDDKLLVLEDTDGDGRADTCTAFADDLHNPTGFEFWNGGVLVAAAPDLLFLEDTDGDGRADRRERLLHGLSSADTHHAANSFVLGPDGALYFQEGTFHQSQVESIHGPVRNRDGCVWRFHPRTWRVERYVPYGFANPHGHVFDRWGQDFVTDGTGNVNYYALPFSGYIAHPAKHSGYFPFFQQRSRPCAGTEILSSRHFPDANQGNYLVANVIGFQGIFQYRIEDDGSGFGAVEVDPLVESTDRNFRPSDIEVGPDGAVYFLDWHNPLIGHLQHHIRDPSRDASHGRVYRVVHAGRPLLEPPAIAGEPIEALLELLRSPEDRTRYRARIELSGRDSDEVVRLARAWAAGLDAADPDHEHHLLEALWLHQQHDRMDRELLLRLLDAEDARARAAATRVLRYGRHHVPDALELLAARAVDAHPRVRLEAVVAASFFDTAGAVDVALRALGQETDRFLDYALNETVRALEPRWRAALRAGEPVAADNEAGVEYLLERVDATELLALPRIPAVLRALLARHGVEAATRRSASVELATEGGASPGAVVLGAIEDVARAQGPHAAHVCHELAELLCAWIADGQGPARGELERVAREGALPAARGAACAGLVQLDGDVAGAWALAGESRSGLEGVLHAVSMIDDEAARRALAPLVRPLQFELPQSLAGDAGGGGLEVALYEPAPREATREVFEATRPTGTYALPTVSLDAPELRGLSELPSFGLAFRGTLHVRAAGTYTFHLGSDDGSRLYVDGTCVVDNDGDHSFATREGSIELEPGPRPLLVTFFDSGGDQGLELEWEGPGIERAPLPASALGGPGTSRLRAAATRAMAQLPAPASAKLGDAARLVGEPALLAAATELARSVPRDERDPADVRPLLDALTAHLSALSPEAGTRPAALGALDLARDLAAGLAEPERGAALAALEGLGGTVIVLRTLPHQMLYDIEAFQVQAGSPVSIVFQNNDVMPHNVVITVPGAMEAVGKAAEALSVQPGAAEAAYVPDLPQVLWHSGLVFPGESERLTFTAPETPGEHPFVCTYPGHWRVMNGVMHVVEKVDAETRVTLREAEPVESSARSFVRDWTVADLAGRFEGDWRGAASAERGRVLFDEAGCIQCHTVAGEGAIAGPELTAIREKYRGLDLLTHVLEPSREVLEDYVFKSFELEAGPDVIGRVIEDDGEDLHVVERLLVPDEVTLVPKDLIVDVWDSKLSPMPSGLLVTFTEGEILDLVRFLESTEASEREQDTEAAGVVYPGGERAEHHIVLLAGDEEYRSEEALPMLGKILSERHGFRCTVLFSTDPETGEIDPDEQTHVPGIEVLDEADMVVCFWRFRELPDADMEHFVRYVESGKPIFGIRTATHAFAYSRDKESPYARYSFNSAEWPGGFGQQVLGDTWISHHGKHGSQSTRGIVDPAGAGHPILRGVDDVWGPTDVYGIRNLPEDATVLLRGQVLEGMEPDSPAVDGPQNEPMMPLVWLRELPAEGGAAQRVICSTIGASVDLESEGLRRVFVNACYWALGLEDEIPERSEVQPVGPYEPTFFGFGKFVPGRSPADHALR